MLQLFFIGNGQLLLLASRLSPEKLVIATTARTLLPISSDGVWVVLDKCWWWHPVWKANNFLSVALLRHCTPAHLVSRRRPHEDLLPLIEAQLFGQESHLHRACALSAELTLVALGDMVPGAITLLHLDFVVGDIRAAVVLGSFPGEFSTTMLLLHSDTCHRGRYKGPDHLEDSRLALSAQLVL